MKKIEPSVQTLTFVLTSASAGKEVNYIDLSQCASIINRRFYRQGINWAVSGFKILSGSGVTGQVSIHKLPNTWVMGNAWEKGFRAWHKQQRESLDGGDQQSVIAKFNDFKIFMDRDHKSKGESRNLLPLSAATLADPVQQALPGEWEYSQIVIPNFQTVGTNIEPYVIGVGDFNLVSDSTQFSLIEAYANSRSVPQSPDPAVPADVLSDTANVYRAMFDVGDNDDQVMDNAVGKNDNLPYPQTLYPGGDGQLTSLQIHDQEFITGTTIGGTTRLKGGNFPCGLVQIATFGISVGDAISIQVNLVPGNHRGYLCEPMTEM
jgi:hypothetical protein